MRILLLFLSFSCLAQDPSTSVNQVIARLNKLRNYQADARIKSDIPLIKILPVNAKVYFKQPDKFRMITKGIAILPKKNGFMDLVALLRNKAQYNALSTGFENINGEKVESITLLPTDDTGEIILAKIWIEPELHLILKSQMTTRTNGTVVSAYQYGKDKEFGLPSEMVITVDVKKFKIPKGVVIDINRTDIVPENKRKIGQIQIFFSNYRVNLGVEDRIFKE